MNLNGKEFLQKEFQIEWENEASNLRLLLEPNIHGGKDYYDLIGCTLMQLTQLSSCYWGCRGTNHDVENLVRRSTNYALASLRLATIGFYDEALGLVRGQAEIANLLRLFISDETMLNKWMNSSSSERRKKFNPSSIRKEIEKCGVPPAIDKEAYGISSEIGIHVTPQSIYRSFEEHRYGGAYFSGDGLYAVMQPHGRISASCLLDAAELLNLSDSLQTDFENNAQNLLTFLDRVLQN